MANSKNENPTSANVPKKADVIIKSNKEIAARLETAIDIFDKGTKDTEDVFKQSLEMFQNLQKENEELKSELKFLYAQFTGIFESIDEKISEIKQQSGQVVSVSHVITEEKRDPDAEPVVVTDNGMQEALLKKLDELYAGLAEQTKRSEETYQNLSDKLEAAYEQNRKTEDAYLDLFEKVNTLSEQTSRSETAYMELSDKFTSGVYETSSVAVAATDMKTFEKIDALADQLKRMDSAHSMLADKFEILSMRIEQFAMEAGKSAPSSVSSTAVAPYIQQAGGQIDYDLLAQKISELFLQEAYSPDYIASKVAEQIVIPNQNPEVRLEDMKLDIDTTELARQVAEQVNRTAENRTVGANVEIDEDSLVDKIAEKLAANAPTPAAVVETPVAAFDEDELADKIALKVGSLKPEDFEILVDDGGCESISKQITNGLDYKSIADSIAEQLREVLDLNAANAPDYEDLAERISSNITVAGINEDAIADKAAAALSNYLPEFDTDEIVDKVTGAVLDVVSAMPQATVDSEGVANAVTDSVVEKLSEIQQKNGDYDIVIDEDGITKITELVMEELKNGTGVRFDKLDENVEELKKSLGEISEKAAAGEQVELTPSAVQELTERFDKVDESIAHINEYLVSEDYEEYEDVPQEDLVKIKEQCDKLEELMTGLNDKLQNITVVQPEEVKAEEEEEPLELSETVVEDLQKDNGARFDKLQEDIAKLTEMIAAQNEPQTEEAAEAQEPADEYAKRFAELEEKLAKLSQTINEQNEKENKNDEQDARFAKVEEQLEKLTELINEDKEYEEKEETHPFQEEDADKETAERIGRIEEELAKLTWLLENKTVKDDTQQDDITELLAGEVEKSTSTRFDKVEDEIAQIKELLAENLAATNAAAEAATAAAEASNLAYKEEDVEEEGAEEPAVEEAAAPEASADDELVKVSDLFDDEEEEDFSLEDIEEDIDDDNEILLKDHDDGLGDDELMPGQTLEGLGGVDFENMMKYKRSFIARIIQSSDDKKNYYGAIKHAMLSYKKVNSNVAWGAERFNKGRETIARIKMRGKTLCLYLALDPNNYKTSVYHHLDASENKSVSGTPMMIKVRSPLGVKKAIRLIDEMLTMRGAEKREIPERDYAAMYPYETIEELIDDGLVKDIRKDK